MIVNDPEASPSGICTRMRTVSPGSTRTNGAVPAAGSSSSGSLRGVIARSPLAEVCSMATWIPWSRRNLRIRK